MKKHIMLFAFLSATLFSLSQNTFLGIWEGKMNAGVDLRMIFHISQDVSKNFIATIDCPDQGLKDINVSSLQLKNDSIHLEIPQFQASYTGKLSSDSVITGMFYQTMSLPLNFKKISKVAIKNRPQTPVGPLPYKSEDLVYTSEDKSITYGATITIPVGKGPFPTALLLTGSGQQNRDEEILGHKPFAVIADHLTRNGFIVLRVDDRGMGNTTGDILSSTTRDFSNDAIVSLNYLKCRKEVDKNKIGLIGHSEGGMIAQIVAAERKDINFIIMLAAPGEKTLKLMSEQNEAFLTKVGLPRESITAYLDLYNTIMISILKSGKDSVTGNVKTIVDTWTAKTKKNIVITTTGIRDEKSKSDFINQCVNQVGRPWFKYFLNYDPAPIIKKITANVLAVNGNKDIQVIAKTNLAGIETALKNGKSESYKVIELEGLNHLFQECNKCTVSEYDQLEETISPALLEIISKWLKKLF
jgi:alpha/beta superfamily hydrolase